MIQHLRDVVGRNADLGHPRGGRPLQIVRAELEGEAATQNRCGLLAAVRDQAGAAALLEYEDRTLASNTVLATRCTQLTYSCHSFLHSANRCSWFHSIPDARIEYEDRDRQQRRDIQTLVRQTAFRARGQELPDHEKPLNQGAAPDPTPGDGAQRIARRPPQQHLGHTSRGCHGTE